MVLKSKLGYATSIQSSQVRNVPPRQISLNIPLPMDQLDRHGYERGKYIPKSFYCSNQIRTSKYTIFTFIPKNLFEQFRRVANTFFLLLVILQAFDIFATVHIGIAAMPIIAIVGMTAIKDAFEDYKRWSSDRVVNDRTSQLLSGNWRNFNHRMIPQSTLLRQVWKKLKRFLDSVMGKKLEKREISDLFEVRSTSAEPANWVDTPWRSIRVGDIVRLNNDEPIPADIIILSTSENDSICYVETKNLDGETNLKLRQGPVDTSWVKTSEDCANRLQLVVESEPPGTHMLRYQATMSLVNMSTSAHDDVNKSNSVGCPTTVINYAPPSFAILMTHGSTKKIPIDINGILMRGAVVRNTQWVIGVVVFTGEDTKQIMNSGKTPSKRSKVDKLMNPHVTLNLAFMLLLCLACSIGYPIWLANLDNGIVIYLYELVGGDLVYEGFLNFWASMILFQNIVPISLYISIEIVKTFQAYFIHEDLEMYYEKNDTRCVPRSWNLSDNLGQIEYIFSDKTGTLTQNIMEFKKCSIGGRIYDGKNQNVRSSMTIDATSPRSTISRHLEANKSMFSFKVVESVSDLQNVGTTDLKPPFVPKHEKKISIMTTATGSQELDPQSGCFDARLLEYFADPELKVSQHGITIREFFKLLAICHTVLVDEKQEDDVDTNEKTKSFTYKAQSPDEACLVTIAAKSGFVFKGRVQRPETGQNEIQVDILDQEEGFELLQILEFDSDRKRMSVIVRPVSKDPNVQNDVILFCKGADTVIMALLAPGQEVMKSRTNKHLEMFAEEGLRTLCLGYRVIPAAKYDDWSKRYMEASTTIFPDPSMRIKALEALNNEVEKDMILLGATAIEDRLQDGVPECITTLASAGIKIWVLTGDKVETAINVGFLCGLLKTTDANEEESSDADMVLIQVKDASSEEEIGKQLRRAKEKFFNQPKTDNIFRQEYALIIDGQSLKYALESEDMKAQLLDLGCRCKAVICCRVSPLQKAKVVELVKKGKQVMTLAIGDGANDVSMIQAADVGVGINGEEGLQAASSADYAIAQFRFLSRLLLVHGRWSYSRISYMILNFYLKSIAFTMVLFWFQFYCGFSSSVIYEFTYMLFYNLIFTALPIMILAVFDQSLHDKICMAMPQLYYSEGIKQALYTNKQFLFYLAESIWHSIICFFLPYAAYGEASINEEGFEPSGLHVGSVMAFSAVLNVNLSVGLDTHSWTWMSHVAIWGSCLVFALCIVVFSSMLESPMFGLSHMLYVDPKFWLTTALCIMLSLGPRFIWRYVQRVWAWRDIHIAQEIQMLVGNGKMDLCEAVRRESIQAKKPDGSRKSLEVPRHDLRRRNSNASTHSLAYSMATGDVSTPHGFSFSHTKGMASVVLRSPLSFITSRSTTNGSISRRDKEKKDRVKSPPSAGIIERTFKLPSRPNTPSLFSKRGSISAPTKPEIAATVVEKENVSRSSLEGDTVVSCQANTGTSQTSMEGQITQVREDGSDDSHAADNVADGKPRDVQSSSSSHVN